MPARTSPAPACSPSPCPLTTSRTLAGAPHPTGLLVATPLRDPASQPTSITRSPAYFLTPCPCVPPCLMWQHRRGARLHYPQRGLGGTEAAGGTQSFQTRPVRITPIPPTCPSGLHHALRRPSPRSYFPRPFYLCMRCERDLLQMAFSPRVAEALPLCFCPCAHVRRYCMWQLCLQTPNLIWNFAQLHRCGLPQVAGAASTTLQTHAHITSAPTRQRARLRKKPPPCVDAHSS
jgi:hypothetical protein